MNSRWMTVSDTGVDYLILGAGTAGCVLANRLSRRPELRVMLIEAGPDYPPGHEPASILDLYPTSHADPQFAWPKLIAEVGADPGDGRPRFARQYVQGRGVGGSSNIMGMLAMRGLPADYDEWRDLGATGWGWEDVLQYFIRCERDLDFSGSMHGQSGPIPVRRNPRASWPPLCRAFAEVLRARGYAFVPDFNGDFADGVSAAPMNNLPDRRVSTAMGYLDVETRRRPNLQLLCSATAESLLFRGHQVIGANVRTPAGRQAISARETIVCAGALHSPAILMRSGIGPADALRRLGIEVVLDLPGVGQNLQNHPALLFAVDLHSHAWQPATQRTWAFSVLRYSSQHPGCPPGDMQINPMNRTGSHPLGRRIGLLGVSVFKSYSRGEVYLQAANPHVPPLIRMNLLSDLRDFDRLVGGAHFALSLLTDPAIAPLRNEVLLPPGGHANPLNRPSLGNWLKSLIIRQLFGVSGTLRRRILKHALLDPTALLSDPEALRNLVRRAAAPVHHVCGTCKLGAKPDPTAVVDPTLRVHGVEGLRIADASVMPTIVTGNTHMPVVMIAEKASDLILSTTKTA